ncbi:ketopantoate reductase family protein [Paenibacillus cymbidii]|uniref:ketopantoate reductase family protein n=1 Tax=Paenibacillus cymbidii TaxID=1639034 RepID=UPI0014366DC4|nr:2-dehydropantoate 2-reductase [Paenibacillus cymbidii]
MFIQIVGGGSIGLLFAGKLAAVSDGLRCAIVARSREQRDALAQAGITVQGGGPAGLAALTPEEAAAQADKPDWLLLAVKQGDIDAAFAALIGGMLGAQTRVLCLQNGIGHLERLSASVPPSRLYAATTTEGARRLSATEVRHTGSGVTLFGRAAAETPAADGAPQAEEAEKKLVSALHSAGFDAAVSNPIHVILWNKLLVSAVINPLTAILGVTNGQLPQLPHAEELMRTLHAEASAVMRACGYEPAPDAWERLLDVCRRTADNRSSMLRDIEEGRATEIDWIVGELLREAEARGEAVPALRTIYRLVKALEARPAPRE